MFILRKLFKEQDKNQYTESNQIIGDNYSTVTEHNEGWEHLISSYTDEEVKDKIHCFLVYDNGASIIPLYKKQGAYIMTSDGKTFSNLTFRN